MEQTITTGVIYYHEPPETGVSKPDKPDRINPCFLHQHQPPSCG